MRKGHAPSSAWAKLLVAVALLPCLPGAPQAQTKILNLGDDTGRFNHSIDSNGVMFSRTLGSGGTLGSPQPQDRPSQPGALADVELTTPFIVSELKGSIYSSRHQPLAEAEFVLAARSNVFVGAFTNTSGSFVLATTKSILLRHGIPPGTYRFKARREGFHSTVGYVILSSGAPKEKAMVIELQPGPYGDDRTLEQRASDWERAQVPPCSPVANLDPKRQKYRGSLVDMPVSLGVCTVRTPEIAIQKKRSYRFMLETDNSLGVKRTTCMLGTFSGPWQRYYFECRDDDPLLKADWTVWLGAQAVERGSSPLEGHASGLAKILGNFKGEAGRKYTVEVKFLKDGSAINTARPHLIVQ